MTVPDFSRSARRSVIAAVADGISSSQVSQYASELAVNEFVRDYLNSSDVWSPRRAAELVLRTLNTRLYIKSQHSPYRENPDKGYVCTFSAVILCGDQAVLLHCGDSSIYHIRENKITLCTKEHRQVGDGGKTYLSNALGIKPELDVDVSVMGVSTGDTFVIMTDGIAETVRPEDWQMALGKFSADLHECCAHIADMALNDGCNDNLTVAVVQVDSISPTQSPAYSTAGYLPFITSTLATGTVIDNWEILRQLSATDRSIVYLAAHIKTQQKAVIKIPAVSMQDSPGFLDEMIKEEWVAVKVSHPHLLAGWPDIGLGEFKRTSFYIVMDYKPGCSLRQWRDDNGAPSLGQWRDWATQLVGALTALHRKEILHQDIRPENVLIDDKGRLTLIDYGAASLSGHNLSAATEQLLIPGDLLFAAPEYFVGLWPDERSEQFSLAILLYYLLSGEYPYDAEVAKKQNYSGLLKLRYKSLIQRNIAVPVWVDAALKRACHPLIAKRYESLSEFLYDLHHPNPAYSGTLPFIERNPVRVWQGISAVLAVMVIALSVMLFGQA
nr:bifunctional protein-serine/threonine kinase/phosphatase [Alteromonas lipolytica]